ncbi:MAG: prepilin-type N-terminal cleavage/methylation domain-containing protein [Solirubrobacteraceae bacterium]
MRRDQDGFTVVEVLIAAVILIVGVLAVFGALDSARVLSLVSERETSLAHRAQQELERIQAIPYKQVAMSAAPPAGSGCPNPLTAAYPTSPDCYVSGSTYEYDRTKTSTSETLAIDATNGVITPNAAGSGCSDGCTSTWSDGRFIGQIFDFVTWTSDPSCSGGTICSTTTDYKRVTVVVTMTGISQPSQPVLVSTLVADPSALPIGAPSNSAQNPLQSPSTQCGGGTCTQALNGTSVDYYLTDSPYSSGYSPPTLPNTLHQTLTTFLCGGLSCPPAPDQLIITRPQTGGVLPPCFSTDLGCVLTNPTSTGEPVSSTPCNGGSTSFDGSGNCQSGLLLKHPSTDSSSCGSPPADNTRSHTWTTPTIPVGTTVNLTGTGGMTLYLQSASGVAVNVTVCLGVYIEPTGLLGSLVNLLPANVTPIGAAVSVNARAGASVPTPASFGFNLGSGAAITSSLTNQAKIQVVVWLAASAGTDVALVYDHPYFASEISVIEQ